MAPGRPRYKRAARLTVATGPPPETDRVHRCFGCRTAPDQVIGKNPDMPPSEPGSNGNDRDVLTSLPRTRPARRSAKRDRPARGSTPPAAPDAASASDTPARAKATAAAKPKPSPTPSAQRPKRAASASAGARKAKAPSGRAKPAAANRSAARKRPARSTPATAAERSAETVVPPAGYATSSSERHGPDPFTIVSTAFQAAGEIAQIGATLWSQAVRSAMNRFPKP